MSFFICPKQPILSKISSKFVIFFRKIVNFVFSSKMQNLAISFVFRPKRICCVAANDWRGAGAECVGSADTGQQVRCQRGRRGRCQHHASDCSQELPTKHPYHHPTAAVPQQGRHAVAIYDTSLLVITANNSNTSLYGAGVYVIVVLLHESTAIAQCSFDMRDSGGAKR